MIFDRLLHQLDAEVEVVAQFAALFVREVVAIQVRPELLESGHVAPDDVFFPAGRDPAQGSGEIAELALACAAVPGRSARWRIPGRPS